MKLKSLQRRFLLRCSLRVGCWMKKKGRRRREKRRNDKPKGSQQHAWWERRQHTTKDTILPRVRGGSKARSRSSAWHTPRIEPAQNLIILGFLNGHDGGASTVHSTSTQGTAHRPAGSLRETSSGPFVKRKRADEKRQPLPRSESRGRLGAKNSHRRACSARSSNRKSAKS